MTQDFRIDIYAAMWMCRQLSSRHRRWGTDCPTLDFDFMVIEYDRAIARALVDYKHERALLSEIVGSANLLAFRELGTGHRDLPVLVVRYQTAPHWAFEVHAANTSARFALGGPMSRLSEADYVRLLYELRNARGVAPEILRNCDQAKPTFAAWPSGCLLAREVA